MKTFRQFVAEDIKPLGIHDFPLIASNPNTNRALNNFITTVNPAIAAGQIIASRLKDAKQYGSSVIEFALRDAIGEKYYFGGKWEILPKEFHDFEYRPMHAGLVTSTLTKLMKVTVDHPMKTELAEILKEAQKIEAVIGFLNTKIVKRLTKAEQEAAYVPPPAARDAQAMVRRALTEMTNEVKDQYIQQIETPWMESLASFFAKEHLDQLKHLKLDPESIAAEKKRHDDALAAHLASGQSKWKFKFDGRMPSYLETMLLPLAAEKSKVGDMPLWTPYPDWKHRVHLRAVSQGEYMQQNFVEKNVRKLAVIVEKKANIQGDPEVVRVSCRSGVIEGELLFKFTDGSKFNVRNKIVSKGYTNAAGQYDIMYQFPTTFHDAILPNGNRMAGQPSEEQMNEIFAKTGA